MWKYGTMDLAMNNVYWLNMLIKQFRRSWAPRYIENSQPSSQSLPNLWKYNPTKLKASSNKCAWETQSVAPASSPIFGGICMQPSFLSPQPPEMCKASGIWRARWRWSHLPQNILQLSQRRRKTSTSGWICPLQEVCSHLVMIAWVYIPAMLLPHGSVGMTAWTVFGLIQDLEDGHPWPFS